jgi:UDP-arabinose 4-epimerase
MLKSEPSILVVGGAGYIGSHICKELRKNGYLPVCYDNLIYGHKQAVKWGPFEKGDILDDKRLKHVFIKYPIEGVIHLAAFAYVGESVTEPSKYYTNNVAGTITLLNAMRNAGVDKIVFSSTCAVYGTPHKIPITEKEPMNPVSPYGASKMMAERIMSDFNRSYGLGYIALRYFNAAGASPDGEIGEMHNPELHLVPLTLDAALGRKELVVFGNRYATPDGTCIRDYIHVSDLARAHVLSLLHLRKKGSVHLSVNLGTGKGHSVFEIIRAAETITGRKIRYRIASPREGDPSALVADPSQAWSVLQWKAEHTDLNEIIRHAWIFHQKSRPRHPVGRSFPRHNAFSFERGAATSSRRSN